ncbi:MAG: hypothetical protein Q9M94_02470 [Candidatus Gracilibacteria bacterium]|nr:hypothetical protein [Candidatus Gracilibacteria bacterium]MDQ7022043.1 hypothetical protein [Candidatus Gracilibacteria bacterium]
MGKTEDTIKIFHKILETFPESFNGQKYLTLKNYRQKNKYLCAVSFNCSE